MREDGGEKMSKKTNKEVLKDLLKKEITALDKEIEEIAYQCNDIIISIDDDWETWNKNANKLKKLVTNSKEIFKIRDYLIDVLESLDQTKLKMETNKEDEIDETEEI